uniref:Uncharacterized protein n=1 Tax=Banana bunchy top virus TaxID=12585 RepID=Q9YRB7_BBTV|nr:unknown [Banana bunchy top virus]
MSRPGAWGNNKPQRLRQQKFIQPPSSDGGIQRPISLLRSMLNYLGTPLYVIISKGTTVFWLLYYLIIQ